MLKKYLWVMLIAVSLATCSNLYAFVPMGIAWPDSAASFYVNPINDSGLSADAVLESMVGGAGTWSMVGASYNFCFQGTTTRRTVAPNGFNDVFFRNQDAGSAIAATYIWRSGSRYTEFDMVFFEARWQFFGLSDTCSGSGFYIWPIAMHEFGHGLGLNHSADRNAIMFASARRCDGRTDLTGDDIDGVTYIYGPGDPPGCP